MTSRGCQRARPATRRQAALPGPLRELHRAVLRRFLQTGRPPATSWIAGAEAGLSLADAAVPEQEAAGGGATSARCLDHTSSVGGSFLLRTTN